MRPCTCADLNKARSQITPITPSVYLFVVQNLSLCICSHQTACDRMKNYFIQQAQHFNPVVILWPASVVDEWIKIKSTLNQCVLFVVSGLFMHCLFSRNRNTSFFYSLGVGIADAIASFQTKDKFRKLNQSYAEGS